MNCIDKVYDLGDAKKEYKPGCIFVHFAPGSTHVGLASTLYSLKWPTGKPHGTYVFRHDSRDPLTAVVMIDNGELKGDTAEQEYAVTLELMRALGLAQGREVYPGAVDSIFAAPLEETPLITKLTDLDKKLVNFIYTKCGPDEKTEMARAKFQSTWSTFNPQWAKSAAKKTD